MDRPIDFETLQRLDQEADALIREGRWTREAFERLWGEGLKACNGESSWLAFLSYPADPVWIPEGRGHARIPNSVTELIDRLKNGWSPRLSLSFVEEVLWNDKPLRSARGHVSWVDGGARISLRCEAAEGDALKAEQSSYVPGTVVRRTLRTTHAGGWTLASEQGCIETIGLTFEDFQARQVTLLASFPTCSSGREPRLWVAALVQPMSVSLGNLEIITNPSRRPPFASRFYYNWGAGHWRLRGGYTYYLVAVKEDDSKQQFLIIEHDSPQSPDREILSRDMMALQLVMGEAASFPAIYGVTGSEIAAYMSVGLRKYDSDQGRARAIPNHLNFERYVEPFFSKLSAALRGETTHRLGAAIEAYLESLSGTVDRQARDLLFSLSTLASWTLREDATAPSTQEIVARAARKLGFQVPLRILNEIAFYRERLASFGALTETIARSDEEHEREGRLIEALRTCLVAMIAATVGYHGPIRGLQRDEDSPDWWPTKEEADEVSLRDYVSVTAPSAPIFATFDPGAQFLIVEHHHHRTIVDALLRAAGFDASSVHILVGDGMHGVRDLLAASMDSSSVAVLLSSKQKIVPLAQEELREQLSLDVKVDVLPATPGVEAWLFADDALVLRTMRESQRLPSEIDPSVQDMEDPYEAAHRFFGPPSMWDFLSRADIRRACERSPSLRHFLSWVARSLGVAFNPTQRFTEESSPRVQETNARVEEIRVKNVRSLADVRVSLSGLTFLVGRNGAGKSSILDAIELLREALTDSLPNALSRRDGFAAVSRRGAETEPMGVSVVMSAGHGGRRIKVLYGFELRTEGKALHIKEMLRVSSDPSLGFVREDDRFHTALPVSPAVPLNRLVLPLVVSNPIWKMVFDAITGMRAYEIHPGAIAQPAPIQGFTNLHKNGENAGDVLEDVELRPEAHEAICGALAAITPGMIKVSSSVERGRRAITFYQSAGGETVPFASNHVSQGTLRSLGMLLALYQHPEPSLVLIDEVEDSIHPHALEAILEVADEISERFPVVLTTHSPEVLSSKHATPDRLRIVQWENGASQVYPLSNGTAESVDRLTTVGDLLRMHALWPSDEPARSGDRFWEMDG